MARLAQARPVSDPLYFRCIADDGCVGYGSVPPDYDRPHILVVTEKGVSCAALAGVTHITKAERDVGLRTCYNSPVWQCTWTMCGP